MRNNRKTDAIELEIYRQLFSSIAEEMGYRLMRSAYSPNIKERRDYSCAIFNAQAEMIAQAAHIPVHLGSTPMSVEAVLAAFAPATMTRGERYILNDPFAGGTHLPDITVVEPVFVGEEKQPRFFVANRAHHADVGGISAGSMPMSRSIDEEGVRIPPTRIEAGTLEEIARQTRTPGERMGDLQAQLASARVGGVRLIELCERHGLSTVEQRASDLIDYAERLVRAIIREIPDGVYRFTDYLDDDGFGTSDIALRCTLTIRGEEAEVDLRECDDQVSGPMNAVRAIAVSAVNYCFRCLGPSDMPSNAGVMRPVTLLTRPGSIVDAQAPAAVAGGNVETSQRIVDLVFGALAQALPHRIPAASSGSMNNLTIGGHDPRADTPFAYYETLAGGAGGGPTRPGADAIHTHMTNTLNTPIEALEHAYPFRITRYAIAPSPDRESIAGNPGGSGVIREYTFETPVEITLLTERRTHLPYGLPTDQHTLSGTPGENRLTHPDGSSEILPAKTTRHLNPGDQLTLKTPSGGGWTDEI